MIRYEFAIIQNKLYGIPVIPLFLGEIEEENQKPKHVPFSRAKAKSILPNKPHARGAAVQADLDRLWY